MVGLRLLHCDSPDVIPLDVIPMTAGDATYFIFIAAVFFIYWAAAGHRTARIGIVLLANYYFCARFGVFYLALLPACSTLDFLVGLGLMRFRGERVRRLLVGVSIAANVTLLWASRHAGWAFPLGLSFYTFQSLTYTLDLYRRDGEGTRNLLAYLSAVSFFPTLQAGPITRVSELIKQFARQPHLDRVEGGRAFFLIAMGLLKKALIADYLAENLVNRVFDTPKLYSGAEVLLAVYAYSLQLYYDFSGYTDIARGAAQLLGIRLPINFDRPYTATNLADFWRRWHISFSSWLRDYLYFALPGKRTKVMPYLNLVITMVLGGLWHGLTWTFAIWGLLHGTALAATRAFQVRRGRVKQPPVWWRRALAVIATYHFVCFTWIFFRAGSVANAVDILERIASLSIGFENVAPLLTVTLIVGAAALFARKQWYTWAMERFAESPFYVHAAALVLVALVLQSLGGRGSAPFVYSRF
jgi:alginate O-acetyltransferase complex protein AlgI